MTLRVRMVEINLELAKRLDRHEREQLSLAFDQAARAIAGESSRTFVRVPPCDRCGRRGYHLARCPNA